MLTMVHNKIPIFSIMTFIIHALTIFHTSISGLSVADPGFDIRGGRKSLKVLTVEVKVII